MSSIEHMVLSWFDWLSYMIIAISLLDLRLNRKLIVQISVLSVLTGFMSYAIDEEFASLIIAVLIFFVTYFTFKLKISKTLIVYALSTIIIISIQGLTISLANLLIENIYNLFIFGVAVQIIGFLLLLLLVWKFPLSILLHFILSGNRVFLYLISNSFALAFALLLSWHFDRSGFMDDFIVIAFLFMTLITINFVILNNGLKNKSQEDELRIYKMYAPMIESLMDDLKSRQHEFDNLIQALKMEIQQYEDNPVIVQSILQMGEANSLSNLAKFQNKLVSGLIYSKVLLANDNDIDFTVILKSYAIKTVMKEYEIVEILGILVDNAFETGVEKNKVYLEISEEKDMSVIQVKNKHPYLSKEEKELFFKRGISSKGVKRGYGLFRLKEICKKYKTDILVDNIELDGTNFVLFEVKIQNG
ncbi:MAG: sensor histidine kinase [Eubacteriales bacterium]